jgi:hypothetical protein
MRIINPFEKLDRRLLEAFCRTNRFWLVSQRFTRAPQTSGSPVAILVTDYDDPGLALVHKKALRSDPYAFVLDLRRENHYEKIKAMMEPGSGYMPYAAVVRSRTDLEKRLNRTISENLRRFIAKATDWQIAGYKTLGCQYETTFGELFVILTFGSQRLRVRLEEVERS